MNPIIAVLSALYRGFISPLVHSLSGPGFGCRYEPSCSRYCSEAIVTHGLVHGALLSIRRIVHCHPWSKSGWDPVPVDCRTLNVRERTP